MVSIEPAECVLAAAEGGAMQHALVNATEARFAFKVRSSDNALLAVNPVFAFIEPGAVAELTVTRKAGPPKQDKLVIQLAEVAPDLADPKAPFLCPGQFQQLTLPISAQ